MPRRLQWSAAWGVAALASAVLLWRYRDYPLMGWDVYPEILSSRILSFDDFLGTFREQTSEGFYPSAFYRPVMNLSLALDYAVWGIEPLGYRLSACLLVGAGALAMFRLCRQLLGPDAKLGPWVGMLGFVLLPVQGEVVPLDSTRMDPLCGLFCMLALGSQLAWQGGPRRWYAAGFTLLAVGSKEAGVLLVPVIALLSLAQAHGSLAQRLRSAWVAVAPHLLATGLVFAARFAALGQLGGHASTSGAGAISRLPMALGLITARSSGLWTTDLGPIPMELLSALAALTVLSFALLGAGALRRPLPPGPELCWLAALAWLISVGGIYGASGLLQSWHLLMPAIAACIGLCGLAEWGATCWLAARRTLGAMATALALGWLAAQARHSPIVHPFEHWARGAIELDAYLGTLSSFIDKAPDGGLLRAPPPPRMRTAAPNPLGSAQATLINYYSLPAWAELRHPSRRILFRHPALGDARAERVPGAVVVDLAGRGL